MFFYHAFNDLKLPGIYDLDPLVKHYQFPESLAGKKVLDVGCASGYFSRLFAHKGGIVTSVDINVAAWTHVRDLAQVPNVTIIEKDCFDINFQDEYDFVFCGSLLMHVIYPMNLLRIIRNALKPGGLFVLSNAGIQSPEPIIRVEPHLGREKGTMESEVQSSNQSLWWTSPPAQINMLQTLNFVRPTHVGSFVLASTGYGTSIGHNFSTLHHTYHAYK